MLRSSVTYLTRRFESLMALANFGASSLFWLTLAFLVTVEDYGLLMAAQAVILLIVALFTLRTHDMVFYLTGPHRYPVGQAWRTAFTVELIGASLCLAVGIAAIFLFSPASFSEPALVAVFLALSTMVVFQQASIAKLRRLERVGVIHAANLLTLASWVVAFGWLFVPTRGGLEQFLIVGAVPQAGRSLVLVLGAMASRQDGNDAVPRATEWGRVARFAISGQAVNFVKNGATSIETTILAAFVAPTAVALYRLSKSTQGMATAFSNVAFQQGSDAIASATNWGQRRDLVRRLRWRGLRGSLATYPFAALFAGAYAWAKPEVGAAEFQLIMIFSFVATLPNILLQGAFIVLSLAGRHGRINAIYMVSALTLGALSCALFVQSSIWIFLAALTAGNVLRLVLLERAAASVEFAQPKPERPYLGAEIPTDAAELATGARPA